MKAEIKKKRVSKRKKIAWRKHVDITDVENFLEDQRLEERLGKPVSEKTNEELFQLDVTPAVITRQSLREKRRLKLLEHPKCQSMLLSHSKVPDPVIKRNRLRTTTERQKNLIVSKVVARKLDKKVKQKAVQTARNRKLNEQNKDEEKSKFDFDKDIWDSKVMRVANAQNIDVRDDEWISGDAERHIMHGQGQRKKIIPKTIGGKASILPSVVPPHPGTSYNPSYKDHQDLLNKIVVKEEEIIKKEEHITRVTKNMCKKISATQQQTNWLSEMAQGLPSTKTSKKEAKESRKEDLENTADYKALNPPVQNKKKTLKQRRKQKEERQMKLSRKSARLEKKKVSDMYRLKFIAKHIEKLDTKSVAEAEKRVKKTEAKQYEAKRLGPTKFEEEELPFNFSNEISGNLRNVKKAGNLLVDRFKSLQKRSVIEPTVPRLRKTAKVKKYTKVGFKEDWKTSISKPASSWKVGVGLGLKPKNARKNKRKPARKQ